MNEYKYYLIEKKAPIAWVYLNRPDKNNAMNPPAWKEAPAVFESLNNDPDIRAIIVAGKGPGFCAGIDLMSMVGEIPDMSTNIIPSDDLFEAVTAFTEKRKPKFTGK